MEQTDLCHRTDDAEDAESLNIGQREYLISDNEGESN